MQKTLTVGWTSTLDRRKRTLRSEEKGLQVVMFKVIKKKEKKEQNGVNQMSELMRKFECDVQCAE